jgi:transposase
LIHALLGHEFLVLYPVNPATAKRYRDAFAPSGAKDDPPDARLLHELLAKHRDHLRPWRPDTVATRQLALLCEHRRRLVDQATRLVQQLIAALKAYYPQALDWAGAELATPMACDFLIRWPSLAALQQARPQTVRTFYYGHGCRRGDTIAARLEAMKTAVALTQDEAIVGAHALLVQALARALRGLLPGIAAHDQQIAARFPTHPDAAVFQSLPAAGPVMAPRLAVAFGTDRDRFPVADSLSQLSGIAPVTRQSGQRRVVQCRRACAKFVRQSLHEWSALTIERSAWAGTYYRGQRAKGKSHHTAVRALAYKWVRVVWRCWRERQPYDEAKYHASLVRHGSPLAVAVVNQKSGE